MFKTWFFIAKFSKQIKAILVCAKKALNEINHLNIGLTVQSEMAFPIKEQNLDA